MQFPKPTEIFLSLSLIYLLWGIMSSQWVELWCLAWQCSGSITLFIMKAQSVVSIIGSWLCHQNVLTCQEQVSPLLIMNKIISSQNWILNERSSKWLTLAPPNNRMYLGSLSCEKEVKVLSKLEGGETKLAYKKTSCGNEKERQE